MLDEIPKWRLFEANQTVKRKVRDYDKLNAPIPSRRSTLTHQKTLTFRTPLWKIIHSRPPSQQPRPCVTFPSKPTQVILRLPLSNCRPDHSITHRSQERFPHCSRTPYKTLELQRQYPSRQPLLFDRPYRTVLLRWQQNIELAFRLLAEIVH